ncbi:glycoside hydrolase, family 31 [Candidatus Moduliflexus flocculans]|uniref:alpha-D-xyloside xylohydrolase n=1 Tax=Candidatus Moduliflexus flocculans TaxID=1499966 RepID=A0A081BR36_9BACT|nr:glycoside hydrolase, family 31 [Candidatus Moduliflexus flocculans]
MRITHGSYALAKGVTYSSIDEVYEYTYNERRLLAHGIYRHRDPRQPGGHVIKVHGMILTVELSSPAPDVIHVKTTHHAQGKQADGKYPIDNSQYHPLKIEDQKDCLLVTSGNVTAKITKSPWKIEFLNDAGNIVTSSPHDGMGWAQTLSGEYMGEKLMIAPDEYVYGMGERFSPFIRNGQHVEIWNGDYATTSDMGYKNVPFYMSSKGYGVLVNSSDKVEFEAATEEVSAVRFTVPGNELDYYLFYGATPKDVLERYTFVTGRPPLVPKWSLGLWLTTSFTTVYNEEIVTEHIEGMEKRDLPLTVFHFDCYWMKERHWCDFEWDRDAFPQPEEMLQRLKARGLHICLWINPYVSELSSLFAEGVENGYFLKRQNGDVYQIDWWQPGLAFVDFTNPAACRWYADKLKMLMAMGADTFKTDFAESAPEDAVYFNGQSGKAMHNMYTLLYNQVVFEVLEEVRGKGDALVFARSATACSHKFPVHWGGDCAANYLSMAAELRGGLSFALSGFAFWSHDIGGFYGQDADVYKRWIAFGLLSSHSRLHGDSSYRVPWNFDEESVDVLRHFTKVRHRLLPYLYSCCKTAHDRGTPVLRPMLLEFPDDPTCLYLDRQYMLGDSLLVAPIFNAAGAAHYYLPAGEWTNFWTNERKQGGQWVKEMVDYLTVPLWIRENSIVPMGQVENAPLRSSFDNLELHLYNITGAARVDLYDDGRTVTITAKREGNDVLLTLSEPIPGATVRVAGKADAVAISGKEVRVKTA